jgi:transcriptional regulator with XRE-family HTH domain/tetratricopeptide (TPR) repeat protein
VASSQHPNVALRRLLTEAGWTEQQLAKAVNETGAETGLALRYDRSAVSHWLAGRRPWGPVPALLAETLSRRLGRPVTLADVGLDPSAQQEQRSEDAIDMLVHLATFSGERRRVLTNGAYSLAALAVPAWAQVRDPARGKRQDQTRLVPARVGAAEQMMSLFTEADANSGGGHARSALAAYLAYDVAPCLNAAASKPLRAKMLTVATQLTYLCAFMCFDDDQHALAQRYYRAALDLAVENGDPAAYAIGLRALSVQARELGHHRPALQLAEVAASTGRRQFPPERQAFFLGQVAVASAADGDRRGAIEALGAAERLLSKAGSAGTGSASAGVGGATLMGSYHPAALAHQQAAVCQLLGDRLGAIDAMSASLRHRPPGERRSRAITTAWLAEIQLAHGHLDEAVATWHGFLDDYPYLRSGRATAALKRLRSMLRPHAANKSAARLLTQAAALA